MNSIQKAPLTEWRDFCKEGKLAYQRDTSGNAVFYPRVIAPKSGDEQLDWAISKGLGTVYSVTTMFSKGQAVGNVALVDIDEGFRMLSSVRTESSELPVVGMRVCVQFEPSSDPEAAPIPVFVRVDGDNQ